MNKCTCPESNGGYPHYKNCPSQICEHCKMDRRKMNPSGYCQHYQNACDVCKKMQQDECEHEYTCWKCNKKPKDQLIN